MNQVVEVQVLLPELAVMRKVGTRKDERGKTRKRREEQELDLLFRAFVFSRFRDSVLGIVTEVIRPDEEPVLKTGGGLESLVSSSLTASACERNKTSCSPAAKAALLQSADRWFESTQDD